MRELKLLYQEISRLLKNKGTWLVLAIMVLLPVIYVAGQFGRLDSPGESTLYGTYTNRYLLYPIVNAKMCIRDSINTVGTLISYVCELLEECYEG